MWQHQGYKQKFYQVDSNISYQTERDKTDFLRLLRAF